MEGKEEGAGGQGFVIGSAYDGYPLESAISATSEATKGQDGLTLTILQKHLKDLCEVQLAQLKG